MLTVMKNAFLLAALTVSCPVLGQPADLSGFPPLGPDQISILWSEQIEPPDGNNNQGVGRGNCAKLTPDQQLLIVTSIRGTVSAYGALTGDLEWTYDPPEDLTVLTRSRSCVAFPVNPVVPYMVYTVVQNENSANGKTVAIALDYDGEPLWVSDPLEGVAAGSPAVSSNGLYTYMTTNSAGKTVGHFYALDAAADGAVLYTESNNTAPFSPLGIFHNPDEGYYTGGADNTNDIMIWCQDFKPDDLEGGTTEIFAFQLPMNFDGTDTTDVAYIQLGNMAWPFQSDLPPVITNGGRSMYWGVSRSGYRAWRGSDSSPGEGRFYFDKRSNIKIGFDRLNNFRAKTVWAAPALTSDPVNPLVFGPSAVEQFVSMTPDLELRGEPRIPGSLVKTTAQISADDQFVYWIESEDGLIHQSFVGNFQDRYTTVLGAPVEGEFDLRDNGSVLYVATTTGVVTAIQLSQIPATPSPTPAPSGMPSEGPTMSPTTAAPSSMPSMTPMPSEEGFVPPTMMPTEEVIPTVMPTEEDVPASSPEPDATPAPGNSDTGAPDSPAAEPDGATDTDSGASARSAMAVATIVGATLCLFL